MSKKVKSLLFNQGKIENLKSAALSDSILPRLDHSHGLVRSLNSTTTFYKISVLVCLHYVVPRMMRPLD